MLKSGRVTGHRWSPKRPRKCPETKCSENVRFVDLFSCSYCERSWLWKKKPLPHGNTCWYVIGDAISRRNQVRREDATTDRRPKQPGFQNGKRPVYCGCSKATIWGTGWSPVSHQCAESKLQKISRPQSEIAPRSDCLSLFGVLARGRMTINVSTLFSIASRYS